MTEDDIDAGFLVIFGITLFAPFIIIFTLVGLLGKVIRLTIPSLVKHFESIIQDSVDSEAY